MENILNRKDREFILERVSKLNIDSKGEWGNMNVGELIVHLADPLRVALGEKESAYIKSDYSEPALRHKIIYEMEWPKESPTSPEFIRGQLGTEPVDFQSDMKSLIETINKFSDKSAEINFTMHPTFGDLSNEDWGRLMWRHFDHHLKQFGL